jgi:DNA-binding CsgD family transcriptional regulator
METLQKISFVDDARKFFCQLPHDTDIERYKNELIDFTELKKILILRNQFFYITDVFNFSNIYVSDTLTRLLGYPKEKFLDMDFVYDCIHPDDVNFVYAFSKKSIAWSYHFADKLLQDPLAGVLSLDYRMKNNIGEYIRINRQTSCFKTDRLGNMIYAISLFTNINHLKSNNLITYACTNDFGVEFSIDDLVEQYQNRILTPRELEIIRLLSQGMSAAQIGKKLFISEYTVIAHRRHILHKIGAKNTAELIKYGMETGLL